MKSQHRIWSAGLLALAVMALPGSIASAQEHPEEHPDKEHPEHPEKTEAAAPAVVTIEQLAVAIGDYVKKDTKLKGGYFLVYDKEAKKPLALTLDHVHKERLSKVGDQLYFACADFKTPDGKVYDLDVFMQGPSAKSLQVTEITVHKEAGVARYTWFEEKGIWKKKTAKAGQ